MKDRPNRRVSGKNLPAAFFLFAALLLVSGCSPVLSTQVSQQVEKLFPSIITVTPTPFQPVRPTPSPTVSATPTLAPTLTPEPVRELIIWLDPSLPEALRNQINLPFDSRWSDTADGSNLQVGAIRGGAPLQAFGSMPWSPPSPPSPMKSVRRRSIGPGAANRVRSSTAGC
jgi:hypothetical protein